MFIGEYWHNIDEKGRLALPAKFRAALGEGAVVTRGLDTCLVVYTQTEWVKLATKLSNLPISQAKSRAFARLMLAGAMDVVPDRQGRVVVPEYLREYGKISKKVVITGLYNRLEIWDEDVWKKYKNETVRDSSEIAEAMGELGV